MAGRVASTTAATSSVAPMTAPLERGVTPKCRTRSRPSRRRCYVGSRGARMTTATTREARRPGAAPAIPKTSQSLWIATSRYPRFRPLKGDLRVDVAVVGGGITGLTAAALLAAAGKSVAVVEASRIAGGVTGYTTAHLTEVVDCP